MNRTYKYQLEIGSKKHQCPKCGKIRFVRFIEINSGRILPSEYGRCDREQKCGYFLKPSDNKPIVSDYKHPEVEYTYLNLEIIMNDDYNYVKEDSFTNFMRSVFPAEKVYELYGRFMIGCKYHWSRNSTVFWYIDHLERVCCGKIMAYNPSNGKRIKKPKPLISSVHYLLKKNSKINDYRIKPCLFGMHQIIDESKDKPIAVCESEKTAIIMSYYYPKFIWMATGSLSNINDTAFNPIKNRPVTLYPDAGAFDKWSNEVKKKLIGFEVKVSDILERQSQQIIPGSDIADLILSKI